MLRCLKEQQNECSEIVAHQKMSDKPAETATKRLNKGYGALLAAGVDVQPASMSYLPAVSLTSSAHSYHTPATPPLSPTNHCSSGVLTPPAQPEAQRSAAPTKALNDATVELEHRKFEEEPVIPAEDMDSLSPIDYWLVRILSSKLGTDKF
jgi:hypothetical protein